MEKQNRLGRTMTDVKIVCVTTMNQRYYDSIGKLMIESWIRYWPEDISLFVYEENFRVPLHKKIISKDWKLCCESQWIEFSKKNKGPSLNFAKKGFAFLDALKNIDCDILIWLDADCLSASYFPKEKILSILPTNKLIALFDCYYQINPNYTFDQYIDYKNRPPMAAESGFVIVNKNHEKFLEYANEYERLFTLDEKPRFLESWYDGEIAITAAREFLDQVEDISKLRDTNKTQTPLNHCWMSKYVIHQKGRVKRYMSEYDMKKIISRGTTLE
jgi:hypothetical protein